MVLGGIEDEISDATVRCGVSFYMQSGGSIDVSITSNQERERELQISLLQNLARIMGVLLSWSSQQDLRSYLDLAFYFLR